MNRIICAILLIASLLLQTFSKSLLLSDYIIHTDKYTASCVAGAMPNMFHKGQCQLNKKLLKIDQSEKKGHQHQKVENWVTFYVPSKVFSLQAITSTDHKQTQFPPVFNSKLKGRLLSVFRPPQV